MQPAPRQVCHSEGGDISGRGDGVSKILNISRNYFAPEAADAIHQEVMRFTRYRRTDQAVADYFVEYDLLCRKAGSMMGLGAGFPDQCASILGMSNAGLSRRVQPLVMASCQNFLMFENASANIRRLVGSRGGGSGQDALFTEEAAEPRVIDKDMDALAAYRRVAKQGAGTKKKEGLPNRGGDKV